MTHRITMQVDQPGTAGTDFAALADRIIQDGWHLPPEGDQSWREQDAQRILGGLGEDGINEEPPAVEDAGPPDEDGDARYAPGFKPLGPAGILLSLAMATGLMLVVVLVSAPQILTAGFRDAPDVKAGAALAPVGEASAAPLAAAGAVNLSAVKELRPGLVGGGYAAPPPAREAAVATSNGNRRIAHAPVKAVAVKAAPRARRGRLPPIGEAYFASHVPAVAARKTESADWKAEVARWDARANEIRARRANSNTD